MRTELSDAVAALFEDAAASSIRSCRQPPFHAVCTGTLPNAIYAFAAHAAPYVEADAPTKLRGGLPK